jgi:hypothetical protein
LTASKLDDLAKRRGGQTGRSRDQHARHRLRVSRGADRNAVLAVRPRRSFPAGWCDRWRRPRDRRTTELGQRLRWVRAAPGPPDFRRQLHPGAVRGSRRRVLRDGHVHELDLRLGAHGRGTAQSAELLVPGRSRRAMAAT